MFLVMNQKILDLKKMTNISYNPTLFKKKKIAPKLLSVTVNDETALLKIVLK